MSRITTKVRLFALAALSTGLLLAAGGTAFAGGGNSAYAKKCQKNGWQTLVTSSGASFASEEECTSYAAQGGVLYSLGAAAYAYQRYESSLRASDQEPQETADVPT